MGCKKDKESMELTRQSILSDIKNYQQRIEGLGLKLSTMPAEPTDWKEKKKVKADGRRWTEEIKHVRRLLSYAAEAYRELN